MLLKYLCSRLFDFWFIVTFLCFIMMKASLPALLLNLFFFQFYFPLFCFCVPFFYLAVWGKNIILIFVYLFWLILIWLMVVWKSFSLKLQTPLLFHMIGISTPSKIIFILSETSMKNMKLYLVSIILCLILILFNFFRQYNLFIA